MTGFTGYLSVHIQQGLNGYSKNILYSKSVYNYVYKSSLQWVYTEYCKIMLIFTQKKQQENVN